MFQATSASSGDSRSRTNATPAALTPAEVPRPRPRGVMNQRRGAGVHVRPGGDQQAGGAGRGGAVEQPVDRHPRPSVPPAPAAARRCDAPCGGASPHGPPRTPAARRGPASPAIGSPTGPAPPRPGRRPRPSRRRRRRARHRRPGPRRGRRSRRRGVRRAANARRRTDGGEGTAALPGGGGGAGPGHHPPPPRPVQRHPAPPPPAPQPTPTGRHREPPTADRRRSSVAFGEVAVKMRFIISPRDVADDGTSVPPLFRRRRSPPPPPTPPQETADVPSARRLRLDGELGGLRGRWCGRRRCATPAVRCG